MRYLPGNVLAEKRERERNFYFFGKKGKDRGEREGNSVPVGEERNEYLQRSRGTMRKKRRKFKKKRLSGKRIAFRSGGEKKEGRGREIVVKGPPLLGGGTPVVGNLFLLDRRGRKDEHFAVSLQIERKGEGS